MKTRYTRLAIMLAAMLLITSGCKKETVYKDIEGFCKSVSIQEVAEANYMLTPGRFVGLAPEEEDDEPYEEKMKRLTSELSVLFKQSDELKAQIRQKLGELGYEL